MYFSNCKQDQLTKLTGMKSTKNIVIALFIGFVCFSIVKAQTNTTDPNNRWTIERAKAWSAEKPWLRGSNFNPSTAINQLEFWQAETFDPQTIDRELGWAANIGMNCMRVYLHHAAWEVDKEGFKNRLNQYLTIAQKHGISTIFVIFDDCWNPTYKTGKTT